MKLRVIVFVSIFISMYGFAESNNNIWGQVGLGLDYGSYGFGLKYSEAGPGYAIYYNRFETPPDILIFGSNIDRETEEVVNFKFDTISILKLWTKNLPRSYLDVGVGLGFGDGTWGANCERVDRFLSSDTICDVRSGSSFGIPVHATAAYGRYLGIGISGNLFITDNKVHGAASIVIPIGHFHRD